MVKQIGLLAAFVLTIALSACNTDKSQQDPADAPSGSAVMASDTAGGSSVDVSTAKNQKLELHLDSGQVFKYRVVQSTVMTMDSVLIKNASRHMYTKTIKGVKADGTFEMAVRLDSMSTDMSATQIGSPTPLQSQHFNSKDSSTMKDPANTMFAAVVGEPLTISMDKQAEIQEVSGAAAIFNKVAAALPQAPPPQEKQKAITAIENMLITSFIQMEYIKFPDAGLDSTLTWSNEQQSQTAPPFVVSAKATYKIVDIKQVKGRRLATIDAVISGTLSALPPPPGSGIKVDIKKSSVNGTSHAIIDLDNGITIAKKNRIMMNVAAEVSGAPGSKGPRIVKQANETNFEVELIP